MILSCGNGIVGFSLWNVNRTGADIFLSRLWNKKSRLLILSKTGSYRTSFEWMKNGSRIKESALLLTTTNLGAQIDAKRSSTGKEEEAGILMTRNCSFLAVFPWVVIGLIDNLFFRRNR